MGFNVVSRRTSVEIVTIVLATGLLVGNSSHCVSADSPDQHTVSEAGAHSDAAEIEKLVAKLRYVWMPNEVNPIVDALVREGDAAVDAIDGRLKADTPDFGMVHHSVRILEQVNSKHSRSLLRRISMGEWTDGNPNLQAWAARALCKCDPDAAWTLLSSTEPQVLTTALNTLDGRPVEKQQLESLKQSLASKNELVSWRAADVMAAGTSGELAIGAIDAIGKALAKVPEIPRADEIPANGVLGGRCTIAESYYGRYRNALMRSNVDNNALQKLAKQLDNRPRDAVIIALANRGDASVHEAIVKLAQDTSAGLLRSYAVDALRKIGTPDDLTMLHKLAENDPLVRDGVLGPPHPVDSIGSTYPVRQSAKNTIVVIERRRRDAGNK